MRLSNININTSFGYNKDYHDRLHANLSKRKQYQRNAQEFIKTDKALLELEDEIVKLEQSPKNTKTDKFNRLTDYLIDSKQILAYHMSSTFGTIKYSDNLIEHYLEEIKSLKDPYAILWRTKLCQVLASFSMKDYSEELGMSKPKKETTQQSNTETQVNPSDASKTLKEVAEQAIDNFLNDKASSLITQFKPSLSSPKGFCDVVGLADEKRELQENIIDYVKNPEQAEIDAKEYGIRAPRGYLFYGPPGCGKTFLVEALAVESGLDMYKMDVSKIGSKYVNQTANNIQSVFDSLEVVSKRNGKPVLLFMDEVDALARNRSGSLSESSEDVKATTTILKQIQDARDKGIIIIAATNKYDLLDDAFISRFDGQQYFGLPDEEQIEALLKNSLSRRLKGQELANNDKALKELSKDLLGYSNRSIVFLIDNAAKIAKRNDRANISSADIKEALENSDFEKIDESIYKKGNKKSKKIGFAV